MTTWKDIKEHHLKIYSTPWCSDCRRLKDRLDNNNLEFIEIEIEIEIEIDIDSNPSAAEYLVKKTGHKAIPYIEIDEKWIVRGWHKEEADRWKDETFFNEFANIVIP